MAESSTRKPLLSVIVPTWNAADWTIRGLRALRRNTVADVHLIWIDNGSDRAEHKAVRAVVETFDHDLEEHDAPLGFSRAVNRGLPYVRGDYAVILNNDVEVCPDWDVDLRGAVDAAPGAAGPLVLNTRIGWQNTRRHPWLDAPLGLTDTVSLARFLKDRWGGQVVDLPPHPSSPFGFFHNMVAFFCVLIPSAVLRDVGALDESFGWGYYEDDDYCRRLRAKGYRISLCLGSSVRHEGGQTMRRVDDPGLLSRNLAYLAEKWKDPSQGVGPPIPQPSEPPMIWSLPLAARRVPLSSQFTKTSGASGPWGRDEARRRPRVGVSLIRHEDADALEHQVRNLLQFLANPVIAVHLNRAFAASNAAVVARLVGLPGVLVTSDDLEPAHARAALEHLGNFRRLAEEASFDYLVLHKNHDLYFAAGCEAYLDQFDAGVIRDPLPASLLVTADEARRDPGLAAMCEHYGGVMPCVSQSEGQFFTRELFAELAPVVDRFVRLHTQPLTIVEDACGDYGKDEFYFATAAAALTDKVGRPIVDLGRKAVIERDAASAPRDLPDGIFAVRQT